MNPLSSILPTIDTHWCIESRYAAAAMAELDAIDYAMHVAVHAARQSGRHSEDDGPGYVMAGDTAVFQLSGPMTKQGASWGGGTSTMALGAALKTALADDAVKSAIVQIDSPGGQVSGTEGLANEIKAFSAKKPIVAVVAGMCCSAAYWAASQCTAIVALGTSQIGSIGTRTEISDTSAMYAMNGIKKHSIATGEYKGAGTPGTVIDAKHLANWQREVDELNAEFLQAVSIGRKMPMETVAELADGRVYAGQAALALGLIDNIATLDDALTALQSRGGTRKLTTAANPRGKETTSEMTLKERFAAWKGETAEPTAEDTRIAAAIEAVTNPPAPPVSANALLIACATAGIDSPAQFADLQKRASYGDSYVASLRETAKARAVTAFGVDTPEGLSAVAQAETMAAGANPEMLSAMIGQYESIAKTAGLTPSAPGRQSAPPALPTAGDATLQNANAETPRLQTTEGYQQYRQPARN